MDATIYVNHQPGLVAVGVMGPDMELLRLFDVVPTRERRDAIRDARQWCMDNGHDVASVEWSEATKVYLDRASTGATTPAPQREICGNSHNAERQGRREATYPERSCSQSESGGN